MPWVKPSPFSGSEEAARRMVDLLAAEGNVAGTPLTSEEREALVGESALPDELFT
jgi:hypothetical protein